MGIDVSAYDIRDPEAEGAYAILVGPKDKWRETRDTQIGILEKLGLTPDQTLLDAGCGSLRAGLPLIGYLDTGHYFGVDIDPDCIAAAQELVDRFNLTHKEPHISLSQEFGLEAFGGRVQMDVIWCYQVFIHLSPAHTERALSAIAHLLKSSGSAYVTIRPSQGSGCLTQRGSWRDFPVISGPAETYTELARTHGLGVEILGTLADFGLPKDRGGAQNLLLKLTHEPAASAD